MNEYILIFFVDQFNFVLDEQFHALEKIKIAETGKRIKNLLADTVRPAISLKAECLADWYKMAQTIYLQTQILQKDLISFEDSLFEVKSRLVRIKDDMKSDKEETKTNVSSSISIRNRLEVQNNVKNMLVYQKEINAILQQNADLIQLIQNVGLDVEEVGFLY